MVGAGEPAAGHGLPEQDLLETGFRHERHTEEKINSSRLAGSPVVTHDFLSVSRRFGHDGEIELRRQPRFFVNDKLSAEIARHEQIAYQRFLSAVALPPSLLCEPVWR